MLDSKSNSSGIELELGLTFATIIKHRTGQWGSIFFLTISKYYFQKIIVDLGTLNNDGQESFLQNNTNK